MWTTSHSFLQRHLQDKCYTCRADRGCFSSPVWRTGRFLLQLLMCKYKNKNQVDGEQQKCSIIVGHKPEADGADVDFRQRRGFMSQLWENICECSVSPHSLIGVITVNHQIPPGWRGLRGRETGGGVTWQEETTLLCSLCGGERLRFVCTVSIQRQ